MNRRPRTHRISASKRLCLTARDVAIFQALSRYRYLRSTYLHALAGGASATRFKERLGDLFHEGYLHRPAKQWEFAGALYQPVVYELGDRGRRVLREEGGLPARWTFLSAKPSKQFAHAVMICACLASFEIACRGTDTRVIGWPEIISRAPQATQRADVPFRIPGPEGDVIPDALFGLEYRLADRSAFRFFALEADRATMPLVRSDCRQSSLSGKLGSYKAALDAGRHRSHLGIPSLLVLTVTTDESRMNAMLAMTQSAPGAAFLFSTVDPKKLIAPTVSLFAAPWKRAKLSSANISHAGLLAHGE